MPIPSITREAAEDLISAVEDIMGEGFQYPGLSGDPESCARSGGVSAPSCCRLAPAGCAP